MEHLAARDTAPLTPVTVAEAAESDVDALAAVAARTFPLACPPTAAAEDVAAFIGTHLTHDRFAAYLADPDRTVLSAQDGARIVGYAMLVRGEPGDADVAAAVRPRPAIEVSKMYVLPDAHGSGVASELMAAAVDRCLSEGAACAWLGVNQDNRRAQRFYVKHGFAVAGTKTFRLGTRIENDYVMVRPLPGVNR